MFRTRYWQALRACILLGCASTLAAADQYHLLGFVGKLCADDPYCFEFLVEDEYTAEVGNRIMVRYASASAIFDPENYELTLQQSNIIPGSHLRMIITPNLSSDPGGYLATIIWIGD